MSWERTKYTYLVSKLKLHISLILMVWCSGNLLTVYSFLTLRRLMSYIYGAPILDVSRSHTTTQHSR